MSLRLRFVRAGERFKIICGLDQLEKMRRVIAHNGGFEEVERMEQDAVYLVVGRAATNGEP